MQEKKRGRTHSRWLLPAALVLAGAAWFENFTLSTSTVTAASAALPEAFSGLRIVQISDLHGRRFDAESRYLLELVRLQSPDLIALTGDLADEFTDFSMLPPLLDGLTALAPTFYVTGNHEWVLSREKRAALFSMLDAAGVVRLQNEYRLLKKGQASIVLAGVDDPNGRMTRSARRSSCARSGNRGAGTRISSCSRTATTSWTCGQTWACRPSSAATATAGSCACRSRALSSGRISICFRTIRQGCTGRGRPA